MNYTLVEYMDKVFEILESFDYPAMVIEFDENDIVNSLMACMRSFRTRNISPMKCAIIIWALTWNYQILPRNC
jgi:hypothetical protein